MKYLLNNTLRLRKRGVIMAFLLSFVCLTIFAQNGIPEKPNPPRLVNDYTGILSPREKEYLENKLTHFNDSTGTQIVVLIVESLGGYDRAEFTYTVLNEWGVGQEGLNNGIVVMVKPTGGQGERHTFIATGYGLEGIIPDVTAKRIIENEMIPHFRDGKYFEGLNKTTDILMSLAAREFTAADYEQKSTPSPFISILPLLVMILFFILMVKAKNRNASYGHKTSLWTLLMLMNAANSRHGGSFGNFNSGRGGFGGFGGGRSGGGGAGGSW